MLSKEITVKKHEIPSTWSIEAADFVTKVR